MGWKFWRGAFVAGLGAIALNACQTSHTPEAPVPPPPPDATVLQAPPPPPPSAFLALLTPEQTAAIRTLGVPLVVPTSIPAGFQVESVVTKTDGRFPGYTVLYRDGGDRCFVVEQTSGGVGSVPATEFRLPINSPLLAGAAEFGLNYGPYAEPAMRQQFPEPVLISDWLPIEDHFYRLAGADYINTVLTPPRACVDVTPEEALQLVESFAVVTDDITGDK